MPALTATPNPAPPSTLVAVAGSGFANAKTRLMLDGVGATTNIFRPRRDGTFNVGITVAGSPRTQTLVAQQQSGSTWSEKARTSIVVENVVVPPPDAKPTITSGPTIGSITQTGATVAWSLSEPCSGQVEYGPTTAYGSFSAIEASLLPSHLQTLTGLLAGTDYHYRVRSRDSANQEVISADAIFTTAAAAPIPPPTAGGYPPDTNLAYIAHPVASLPTLYQKITDPTLRNVAITRITSDGIRHAYSKTQPWNSDGTLLLMTYGSRLLDGNTYQLVKALGSLPGYANWSPTDPKVLYGTWDGDPNLYRLDVISGALSSVKDFGRSISLGKGEGSISDNGKVCLLDNSNNFAVVTVATGSATAWFPLGGNADNATMSRDGNWVGVDFGSQNDGSGPGKGMWVFPATGGAGRQLATVSRHGDTAVDSAGRQVWVNVANGVEMYDLAIGTTTKLLPAPNAYGEGHVSGRGLPGWAYLSDYSAGGAQLGDDQLVAVKLDGSKTVQVFGFANRRASAYESQPQAVPSRDGKRILFASDYNTASYYDFVVEAL